MDPTRIALACLLLACQPEGRTAQLRLPTGWLLRSFRGPLFSDLRNWALAARDADGGLHWETIDGTWSWGWVQDDRVYLIGDDGGTVAVLAR